MRDLNIFIPYNIEYSLIYNIPTNKVYLYLYSKDFFFCTDCAKHNIFINNDTNTINIRGYTFNYKNKLLNKELSKFLFSWDSVFFNKIRFAGKGFKFKKKINNLFLFFNRAHKCFFIGNNILLIRLSKNKVIMLKNNHNHLIHDSRLITAIRSNNVFTKRGLRFSRQIIFKKRGKTATR